MSEWQPIETAPTEHGTRFLVWANQRHATVYEAQRFNDRQGNEVRLCYGYGSHNEHTILSNVTHWMPLPAPPPQGGTDAA